MVRFDLLLPSGVDRANKIPDRSGMTTATRIPQRRGDSVGESDAGRRSIDWQLNRWLEQHYSPRDEMCKICAKWWDVEHECPGSGKTSWGCLLVITPTRWFTFKPVLQLSNRYKPLLWATYKNDHQYRFSMMNLSELLDIISIKFKTWYRRCKFKHF